jgi:putative membrane protein
MRFPLPMLAAIAAAACMAPATAQIGNPAGTKPESVPAPPGKPAPHDANDQDRLFVQLLGAGGTAEVDAGKLAGERTRSGAVKAFAQEMVRDHTAAGSQLATLARQASIPWPSTLDPDHEAMHHGLEAVSADRFDAVYLHGQLVDHQKTVQLLEWEIGSGQDADLQRYAANTLPTVLAHLRHVQQLLAAASGAPPQGLGAQASAR